MNNFWQYHPLRQCLALVVFLFALLASSAPAVGREGLLFILDSSGSMWGRLDQQAKTVTAKKILAKLLEELPATMDVGLMSYGHRRKGDCGDIEMISVMGTVPAEISSAMKKLNALGKTPISEALVTAGKQRGTNHHGADQRRHRDLCW
jgi:Ca-activated chloride channel homolog